MTRVAVIEDDLPTSNQLAGWIRAARPGIEVDQWFDRDTAEAALAREAYDVVLLDIELGRERHARQAPVPVRNEDLALDPLWQRTPTWRGQRINLPLTAQRILATLHQRRGEVVSYDELFDVVKSGRNRDNVRKHVSTIRDAFREVDPGFQRIENVPMRGFRWVDAGAPPQRP
jgi:two-component system response regulator ChvI